MAIDQPPMRRNDKHDREDPPHGVCLMLARCYLIFAALLASVIVGLWVATLITGSQWLAGGAIAVTIGLPKWIIKLARKRARWAALAERIKRQQLTQSGQIDNAEEDQPGANEILLEDNRMITEDDSSAGKNKHMKKPGNVIKKGSSNKKGRER